jgi:exonuclease III
LTRRMRRVRKLAEPSRMRVGTWNVGSLTGKFREVVDTIISQRVNILYVQDTKWKGQNAKKVEDTDFKLWYTENTPIKNGVSIVLDKRLKDGVVNIKRQGDIIILMKLLVRDLIFNVISAYAP